jgi:hypothetical protein
MYELQWLAVSGVLLVLAFCCILEAGRLLDSDKYNRAFAGFVLAMILGTGTIVSAMYAEGEYQKFVKRDMVVAAIVSMAKSCPGSKETAVREAGYAKTYRQSVNQ